VGSRLIQAALYWFAEKGVNSVSVVTEGGNARAIRLYEHSGFRADSFDIWYHFWPLRRM
jgi:GNAT superfamily N-acetyltransferase